MKFLRAHALLLAVFTFVLLGYLLSIDDQGSMMQRVVVERVIDGDTFEFNNTKFRLLGINTPEKGELLYDDAKSFLEGFEGNISFFESFGEDKYGRTLGYLHFNNLLVNKELASRGLAVSYYYDDDRYTGEIVREESIARSLGLGLWQKSSDSCSKCIIIDDLHNGANEDDCVSSIEFVRLKNSCNYDCSINDWMIKDSSSAHTYTFSNIVMAPYSILILFNGVGDDSPNEGIFFFNNKPINGCYNIWNDDGDSLFLRDNKGLLVIFYRY